MCNYPAASVIDPFNEIVRDLVQSRLPALSGATQIGFEPPNEDWRNAVATAGEERLNFYLYEIRENVKLRTNERLKVEEGGWTRSIRLPARLDCHYLITAWSPVTLTPAVEPTRDEHARLYEALDVLMRLRPLAPRDVYKAGVSIPSGRTILSVPVELRDSELPLEIALPEGIRSFGDFWTTMKVAWKPALHMTVTLPVLFDQAGIEVPMVTTLIADYRQSHDPAAVETFLTVGGAVLSPAGDAVKGAWVQISGIDPPDLLAVRLRMVVREDGRFVFSRMRPGRYQLRSVAAGLGDVAMDINLPSETGEYDLRFP